MNSQHYKVEYYTHEHNLERYETYSSKYNFFIYPMIATNYTCTVMLFKNLAEPDWSQISCKKPFLHEFLCVKFNSNNASLYNLNELRSTKFCTKNCILFNNTCFKFLWQKPTLLQECLNFKSGFAHRNTIAKFPKQLIDYVSVERTFPLFLVYFKNNTTVVLKVKKYNNIVISKM